MRTYTCNRCASSIIVGHPGSLFRRQARLLARDTYSLLDRLLHRQTILHKFVSAMEEKFYLEPHRYRALPSACPKCGFRSEGDLSWWKPGLIYAD